jgi:nucleotide-binding universal stress UspA family protein
MVFKRILCAIDFSSDSLTAFSLAVETAKLHSASVHIFHVIEAQPVVPEWLPIHGLSELELYMLNKANGAMESLIRSAESSLRGLKFTTEVTSGRAFVEIVNRAREWHSDLIVLGSKGVASLEDAIAGSTSERVMKTAPCSVLIAKPGLSAAQQK